MVVKMGENNGLAWDEVAAKMSIGERVKIVADKDYLYFGSNMCGSNLPGH